MEKRSKTNKEIYEQKFPIEELSHSPILCAEAIGYLKALKEYFPSEQTWIKSETETLLIAMLFYTL